MSAKRGPRARRRIGVADTTFARWDMGRAVVDELKNRPGDFDILRTTVPGIKDLPVACKTLIEGRGGDLACARARGERVADAVQARGAGRDGGDGPTPGARGRGTDPGGFT